MGWLSKLFNLDSFSDEAHKRHASQQSGSMASGSEATKRLKLVLMHDRTQLSPAVLEAMRDELITVISKYVEIDRDALNLNLESESNTMALVANIPILRARV